MFQSRRPQAWEIGLRLQFFGTGDAFGSSGRFNTCFRVAREEGDFLIDCGASSLIALRKLGVEPNAIRTIFITHLHGDHFGGLPFFLLDAQFYSRRQTPLTLVGPPGFRERLAKAMEVFFPGSSTAKRKFETIVHEVGPGSVTEIEGISLTTVEMRHACGSPALGLRFQMAGKTIAYSGDGEWSDALIELGRGADLFIVEALTFERKISQHLDYTSVRDNADRIGAKRIILTHFGQRCWPDSVRRNMRRRRMASWWRSDSDRLIWAKSGQSNRLTAPYAIRRKRELTPERTVSAAVDCAKFRGVGVLKNS